MQIIHLKNLKMVSEAEVAQYSISLEHLWLVNHNDELFGPFNENDVKACFFSNPEEYQNTLVCNMQDAQWVPVFKHKTFQRRKPQLLAVASEESEQLEIDSNSQIYLLKHGQKIGPITLNDLNTKIDEKAILMTDFLSIDQGKSWQKVYQYPVLNRREVLNADHLPNANLKVDIKTPLQIIKNDIEQDVAGLAFIHRLKNAQAVEIDPLQFGHEKQKTLNRLKNKTAFSAIAACACVIIILVATLSGGKNATTNKREIASNNSINEVVETRQEGAKPASNRRLNNSQEQIRKNNANGIRNIQNKRNTVVVNKNITNTRLPRARRNVSPIRGANHSGIRPNNSTNHSADSVDNYADNNDERLKDPRDEFENKNGRSIAQNPYSDERDKAQEAINQVDQELQSEYRSDDENNNYNEVVNDF